MSSKNVSTFSMLAFLVGLVIASMALAGGGETKNLYENVCPYCHAHLDRGEHHRWNCPLNENGSGPSPPIPRETPEQMRERFRKAHEKNMEEEEKSKEKSREFRKRVDQETADAKAKIDAESQRAQDRRADELRDATAAESQTNKRSMRNALNDFNRSIVAQQMLHDAETANDVQSNWQSFVREAEREREAQNADAAKAIAVRFHVSSEEDAMDHLQNMNTKIKIAERMAAAIDVDERTAIAVGAAAQFNQYVAKPAADFVRGVGTNIDRIFRESSQKAEGQGGIATSGTPAGPALRVQDRGFFRYFYNPPLATAQPPEEISAEELNRQHRLRDRQDGITKDQYR